MVLEQSAQGVAVLPETPTGEAKLFFKAKKKKKTEILLEVSVGHVAE